MRFQWISVMAVAAATVLTACGGDGVAGIPVTTTVTTTPTSDKVAATEWVSAVCTGFTEAFRTAPTDEELATMAPDAVTKRYLEFLDVQQAATEEAADNLTELGPPDISDGARQVHRDMVTTFTDIAENTEDERRTVGELSQAGRDGDAKLVLHIAANGGNHLYGLDIVEDNEELDAAAQQTPACTRMYDELAHLLS
ncbi:hypothetical protein [Actinophytocola sp. NPDC049390]|uniref:hypothetical protein n=1 Tax=Actinophytocola sp. NPDC049390 TaxID=3363894 RepID=UPI00378C3136